MYVLIVRFFFFRFATEESVNKVLNFKLRKMYNNHVFLKKWSADFDTNKEEYKDVQAWLKISGIPANCWNKKGINDVAGEIGLLISVDEVIGSSCYALLAKCLLRNLLVVSFHYKLKC